MAGVGQLKIKLPQGKMRALYAAHNIALRHYEVENDHELLLYHFLLKFRNDFEKKLNNEQSNYGIRLEAMDALAFCQIWGPVQLSDFPDYEALVMQEVLSQIDKYRKSIQMHTYETPITEETEYDTVG